MITEKQRDAARANGAKSRGPVTAEGKERSSKNATTHGLSATTVVLPGESEQRYFALLQSMLQAYAPNTDYEVSLVERMAALNWQQDRLLGIDTMTLAVQMDIVEPALNAEVENLSTPVLIALAYRDLSTSSRVLPNLDRHASRIRRQFTQLRTELLALQKPHTAPKTQEQPSGRPRQKLQNEPTGEQPIVAEQITSPSSNGTSPEAEPGTSMTGCPASTHAPRPGMTNTCHVNDPSLLASGFSPKLQNEPTGEQPIAIEQHTEPARDAGTSVTGHPTLAGHPRPETTQTRPTTGPPQSHSDSFQKLQNEPAGEQAQSNQPVDTHRP